MEWKEQPKPTCGISSHLSTFQKEPPHPRLTHTHCCCQLQTAATIAAVNAPPLASMAADSLAQQALDLLNHQLTQPQPCVATASVVLGTLQDRLLHDKDGACQQQHQLSSAVVAHMQRFHDAFVTPAAAKLSTCKTAQDKVVAMAKFLRGKLAKAPAHKQPLHTQVRTSPSSQAPVQHCSRRSHHAPIAAAAVCMQYLPSALRESGKRQLDCLGIATAVLAMCHQVAAQQPEQHSQLAAVVMVVSDDHCWLALPAAGQAAAAAGDDSSSDQQQQEVVHIEVTDPGCVCEFPWFLQPYNLRGLSTSVYDDLLSAACVCVCVCCCCCCCTRAQCADTQPVGMQLAVCWWPRHPVQPRAGGAGAGGRDHA